jgi:acetyl-CoA C-acetyltransferase
MPEAVIVDAIRTPIGRAFKGSLTDVRPDDLGAFVIDTLLDRNGAVDPESVDDVICGCGFPQGEQGFNIARIMTLLSRLPEEVAATTVSRYCASSLQAIRMAAHAVNAGDGDTFIAAGVESVTRMSPHSEIALPEDTHPQLRGQDGQTDAYISMGETAENVADRYRVSREAMDEYAQRSQERAVEAIDSGFFEREIVPVELPDGTTVAQDDGPRRDSSYEKLAELSPSFRPDGKVTAGNSCPLNDGAAAVLVMSDERARELDLVPKARVIASATSALAPEIMGVAPIRAIRAVLDRAGMSVDDIDLWEINEAFAAQILPIVEEVGIDVDKLNTHGGAIALGHPFGMTGARIMTSLLNGLEWEDQTVGLETMCVAGGQGMAMLVERLN